MKSNYPGWQCRWPKRRQRMWPKRWTWSGPCILSDSWPERPHRTKWPTPANRCGRERICVLLLKSLLWLQIERIDWLTGQTQETCLWPVAWTCCSHSDWAIRTRRWRKRQFECWSAKSWSMKSYQKALKTREEFLIMDTKIISRHNNRRHLSAEFQSFSQAAWSFSGPEMIEKCEKEMSNWIEVKYEGVRMCNMVGNRQISRAESNFQNQQQPV